MKITFLSLLTLATVSLSVLSISNRAQALNLLNNPCTNGASSSSVCKDNHPNGSNPIFGPNGILTSAINILSYIIGAAAVIVIIISGLRMVVSNGDTNAVSSARNAILYALIGVAVALVAQVIVAFILSKV